MFFKDYFLRYKWRILIGLAVMLWLRFLLIPTATVFYELYHYTGIDGIYWGYSLFKATGYYFGVWQYQTLTCVIVGLLIAVPWWQALKFSFKRGGRV